MAFKTPKNSVLTAKKIAFKMPKIAFNMLKMAYNFYKMDPWECPEKDKKIKDKA